MNRLRGGNKAAYFDNPQLIKLWKKWGSKDVKLKHSPLALSIPQCMAFSLNAIWPSAQEELGEEVKFQAPLAALDE